MTDIYLAVGQAVIASTIALTIWLTIAGTYLLVHRRGRR